VRVAATAPGDEESQLTDVQNRRIPRRGIISSAIGRTAHLLRSPRVVLADGTDSLQVEKREHRQQSHSISVRETHKVLIQVKHRRPVGRDPGGIGIAGALACVGGGGRGDE
jgi:hypothetical protein